MKKFLKRLVTFALALTLIFGVVQIDAYAANKYKINGVTVSVTDYSSSPNECWWYANHLYKKIWGHYFTNQFGDIENSLRNLKNSQLTLTPEHLKQYVLNAEVGSVLRVCDSQYLHANDGWGHSQLIVQIDNDGFTVLEGGLSAYPYRREHYYTWEDFCYSRWPGKYAYIKYVKWPGAPAFSEPNGTLSVKYDGYSSAVTLNWTTYWDYNEMYKIERATSEDGPWTVVKKVTDGDTMSWTDTTAKPGKNYYYRVEPYNDDGDDGRYTNVIHVLTRAELEAVSTSSATPSIALTWSKTEGYTSSYEVHRATKVSGPWTVVKTITDGNTTTWTDTDIESGQTYYYFVRPFNSDKKNGSSSYIVNSKAMKLSAEPFDGTVTRLYGKSRYHTAYQAAEELKAQLGVEKFGAVVIATGKDFADALSGSYLAYVKKAPMLLTDGTSDADSLKEYLDENLSEDGQVYILGGTKAVSENIEKAFSDYEVKRVKGKNRYETNIEILKEAGVAEGEMIVCTGTNYADSLSASAVKLPILLVGDVLTDSQKAYLSEVGCGKYYIVGGTAAVNKAVEEALLTQGSIRRLSGKTRYETSVKVAETFCTDVSAAVVAYGKNFPDGLCGGPLAASMNAPLILTDADACVTTQEYVTENPVKEGFVLGGNAALSDLTVRVAFDMSAEDTIQEKKFQ